MECNNESSIHLIRDRKFFQTCERSAFRFVKFLREYKVHHKFVKKIGADVVYLGFPDSVLESLRAETQDAGYERKIISDDQHIEISGLPKLESYDAWKTGIVRYVDNVSTNVSKTSSIEEIGFPSKKRFVIYRVFYDLTLYLCRLTSKFHRNFKFGLGDKLREDCVLYLTDMQCIVQSKKSFERSVFEEFLVSMQIRLRLLLDLKQVTEKQWFFVNQTIGNL
ncbi:MAG: hypothetical protein MJZ26_10530 [Fibrobacter sp.]|nr:hypothetical protein [Fibrobacter sp.]